MRKFDLKKQRRDLYNPSAGQYSVVDVPEMQFLMIDGSGDPNTSQAFQDAVGALYGMSYTLKFHSKEAEGIDYTVMPLEGLWWGEDMAEFSIDDKSVWRWTAMIAQPAHITVEEIETAREEVRRKKDPPALGLVRLEPFCEGLSVQIMYIGPYADEGPTVAGLHRFAADGGYRLRGKHHEIYLGDPRRSAPEKLRTVIRHPVEVISP